MVEFQEQRESFIQLKTVNILKKKSEKKLAIASKSLVILTLGQGPNSLFKETNFSILKNQNWKKYIY